MVDVGALAVAVEDHYEFGGLIESRDGVRCHGGELGGLSRLDGDLAVTEQQTHSSFDDEEPIVTGVYLLLCRPVGRFQSNFDRKRPARRAAQHPCRPLARAARRRMDHHVLVAAHVEKRVEVDLESRCQRQQDVEADRPLPGLDPTDSGGTQVGASGKLVEGQTQRVAKAPQSGANYMIDLVWLSHLSSGVLRILQQCLQF